MLSWKINEQSLQKALANARNFEQKVIRKAIRKGFTNWAKEVQAAIRANITWNDKQLRRSITYKIKSKKKRIWCGVGAPSGKLVGVGSTGDKIWLAHKSRWYNDGFRVIQKGFKSGRTGKNWREGLRGQGLGSKIYQTNFITNAHATHQSRVVDHIIRSIKEATEQNG
jgi:hypothetical protein